MIRMIFLVTAILGSGTLSAIEAESPKSSCEGIMKLVDQEKYKEALEEARWCVEALEGNLQGAVTSFFKEEVADWKRVDVRQESAMGMSTITGEYQRGDDELTVTLLGSQGSGSAFGGALGGLAQLGMMQSNKRFRVQKLKATVDDQGQIMVTLDDGAFITVESPQYDRQEDALNELEAFLDAFPFAEINEQRR